MAQGVLKKFFLKIPVKNESFLPFFVLEMLQAPFISEGQKKGKPLKMLDFQGFLAEGVGFEPTWGLSPKRFSRPPRYDRFDNPPYICLSSEKLKI